MHGRGPHEPAPSGGGRRGGAWLTPRRQMVGIGLVGAAVPLLLLGAALGALDDVKDAHAAVDEISDAQSDFQDADMAHDAMRADVLTLLVPAAGIPVDEAREALDADVDDYEEHLDAVDDVELSPMLERRLAQVRPLQERYVRDVREFSATVTADPVRANAMLPRLTGQFQALLEEQRAITTAMSMEADRLANRAEAADRQVRMRLTGAAVVTLLGMLGLTYALHRLGGRLATMLARERGVAETLQHSLLPESLPDVPGVRLAARYVPGSVGSQVGGDWYDVIPLPSGEVGLVMGDVVGHDLDAAADMGQLRNALRALAAEGAAPQDVLARLNRLCLQQGLGSMATVLYAVLDPVLGTLRMANAGHYPPLLVDGRRRYLEVDPCPPIGAVREVQYTSTLHHLPAGSVLVLYTDGLVESRDLPVDQGMADLATQVAVAQPGREGAPGAPDGPDAGRHTVSQQGLERLCDAVLAGMLRGRPPQDDIALLVVAAQARLGGRLAFTIPAQADQLSVLRRTLERWLTEAGASDEEVYEITVACSEATTNAIEHAYGPARAEVEVVCEEDDGRVTLAVRDWGQWRDARGRDRGRGLYLMRELMADVVVTHGDRGTQVLMSRRLGVELEEQRVGEAVEPVVAADRGVPA